MTDQSRTTPRHDHPHGPLMGWSAGDFGRDHLLEPGEVEARTEPVHDGTQTDPE